MSVYLDIPKEKSPVKLADWLEINALLDLDRSVSEEDLKDLFLITEDKGDDQIEESETNSILSDAFNEVARRVIAAREFYPFEIVDGNKVRFSRAEGDCLPYVFCLLISYFGLENSQYSDDWTKENVTKLFELLSGAAAKALFHNDKIPADIEIFGWPRKWEGDVKNPDFEAALTSLCSRCVELKSRKRVIAANAKDAGLDIVLWKSFPDKMHGGFLFFGQCATGGNWTQKLSDVTRFNFFIDDCSAPMKGVFIPHLVDAYDAEGQENWLNYIEQIDGVLFTRCRIAFLAGGWADGNIKKICEEAFASIRSSAEPNHA